MLNEFKKFILKGNVIDLSTGVIIGAAFGGIVTGFTKGIVEPLLRLIPSGATKTSGLAWEISKYTNEKGEQVANLIDFNVILNSVINFIITAAVIFFVIVKPANKLMSMMKKEEAAAPPPPPEDVKLLTEIRDLLKK